MKVKSLVLFTIIPAIFLFAACGAPSTTNTQATIDAAVQATTVAQQNTQATVEAAVKATDQARATQTPALQPTSQATATAQPTPEYDNMTEEELAALIDDSVNQALADYETTSATTTQATSDGVVTAEEAVAAATSATNVSNEIAYAEELIQAYNEYYGEYADETLATMTAIEQDLETISNSLTEIVTITEQGAETASAAIEQLNAAIVKAQANATDIQTKIQGWQEQVKTSLGQREDKLLNLAPDNVSNDQLGALIQAHDFLDAFKGALADGKFSPAELENIGRLGANARASLDKTGDPKLQGLSGMVDGLTRNAARGEWNHARSGVGDFERSLPKRPQRR